MSAGRLDSDPREAPLLSLLASLRRHIVLLATFALLGGALAMAALLLRTSTFRAVATLLVVEPRLGGGGVDFNLTPIRSYLALLTSPALCEPCAALVAAKVPHESVGPRVKVRMPENTRLLEVSFEGPDPVAAAAFVNCVTSRAQLENRRLNLELQTRMRSTIEEALGPARAGVETLEAALASARARELLELKRKELRQAFAEFETSRDERLKARLQLAQAQAHVKSYGLLTVRSAPSPQVLELGEKGLAEAHADEGAARAVAAEAENAGREAQRRATLLERDLARAEGALDKLRRGFEGAAAVEAEMLKRSRLASIEAAAKSFDLITMAPASAPSRPSTPPPLLVAAAGAFAALLLGALVVLSRP